MINDLDQILQLLSRLEFLLPSLHLFGRLYGVDVVLRAERVLQCIDSQCQRYQVLIHSTEHVLVRPIGHSLVVVRLQAQLQLHLIHLGGLVILARVF